MGEVYKARDTRLGRIVAIKVLSAQLAADPQFRERFDREAKVIAALTHPHVCSLYDVGHQDGTHYLVMEFLEGQTLAEQLQKRRLLLDQALKVAIEIADALDTAHRAGIVHRDLKPGNIMLTSSGAKLLDFGLAKHGAAAVDGGMSALLTTSPPSLTVQGTILGTFQYMAPEQLEGKNADARTDIFAFGAVVYEMITGRKAFEGNTSANVMAAIMSAEPPSIASLVPVSPPMLEHVLMRCLKKDREQRWQSVQDVRLELESIREAPSRTSGSTPIRLRSRAGQWLAWTVSAGLLAALVATIWLRSVSPRQEQRNARLSIVPPEQTTFLGGYAAPYLALSPDGQRLAFVPTPIAGRTLIWIRSIDALAARPLAATDGASFPFWSPDGRQIAFFADGKLKVIDSNGGIPHAICDAPDSRGGAWSRNGVIVFSPQLAGPLYRVSPSGGRSVAVTSLDASRQEISHRLPSFLPDGQHFLFLVQSGRPDNSVVNIGSVDSKEARPLNILGSKAVYSDGFILFARDQSLMAQAFDLSRLELSGEPVSLGDPIVFRTTVFGDANFSVADNRTLSYWNGGQSATTLAWFARNGRPLGSLGAPANYYSLALSPDERNVAVEIGDPVTQTADIWLIDVANGIRSRFTSGRTFNWGPLWSPDGAQIVFGSLRSGPSSLYRKRVTESGSEELLLKTPDFLGATTWSSDGRLILFQNVTTAKINLLPLSGDRAPRSILPTEFVQGDGRLSPDGRWLAYTSNESGTWDVYVQPFPSLNRKWRISPDGGSRAQWRGDGRELFYISPDQKLVAVTVTAEPSFTAGAPRPLFDVRVMPFPPAYPREQFAVAANGDRFLVNTFAEPVVSPITLELNLDAALRK
jgi:serine/threonine protein kinase/Tol biopolymer transport system component